MATNTATLQIRVQVDGNGAVKVLDGVGKASKHAGDEGKRSFDKMGSAANSMHSQLIKAGAAMGGLYMAQKIGGGFLRTAADFEKLEISLTTLLGSSLKAEQAVAWISEFTAKTPYELLEVSAAFQKLTFYGMDATKYLGMLGDTASGMSKDLNMAVEMFADAATGEFERLKEFGVKAKTEGDIVTFAWSQNGKDMTLSAQKTQSGISTALEQIFQRFKGGMKAQATSWDGLMSMMSDTWTMTEKEVMDAGAFEAMKEELKKINEETSNWLKSNKELIALKVPEYVDNIKSSVSGLYDVYTSLPDELVGAAGYGILGRMLFGSWKVGLLLGAVKEVYDYIQKSQDPIGGRQFEIDKIQGILSSQKTTTKTDPIGDQARNRIAELKQEISDIQQFGRVISEPFERLGLVAQKAKKDTYEIGTAFGVVEKKSGLFAVLGENFEIAAKSSGTATTAITTNSKANDAAAKAAENHAKKIADMIAFNREELDRMARDMAASDYEGVEANFQWDENIKQEAQKQADEIAAIFDKKIELTFADDSLSQITNLMTGVSNLTNEWENHAKILEKIKDRYGEGAEAQVWIAKESERSTQAQLAGYSNLFGVMSGYFDEESSQRKYLHGLEVAFGAASIAMELKKTAVVVASAATEYAAIAGGLAVKAASAILGQASVGGPYAFAAMAAMAAAVAGVMSMAGVSWGGGGGGSSTSRAASPTTGTVLGAPDQASESLQKSLDILADFSELQYGELKSIYSEFKNLNQNLTGISNSILRSVGVFDKADFDASNFVGKGSLYDETGAIGTWNNINNPFNLTKDLFGDNIVTDLLGVAGDITDKLAGWITDGLFGGEQKKKLMQAGIEIGEISIAEIIAGINASVQNYGEIKTTTDGGWLHSDKVRFDLIYTEASADTNNLINKMFQNTADAFLMFADIFGVPVKKIKDYVFDLQSIDLLDLSGEDAAKELNAWYSKMMDEAFSTLFSDIIGKYQEVNEGLLETATRLVAGMGIVEAMANVTGAGFSDNGSPSSGGRLAASAAMVEAAGGLDNLKDLFDNFYAEFVPETVKLENTFKSLTSILGENAAIPETTDAFMGLFKALDLTKEEDWKLALSLMEVAPAIGKYYDAIEQQRQTLSNMANDLDVASGNISGLDQTLKGIDDKAGTYRDTLIDNGMALDEAKLKTDEWTESMTELVKQQMINDTTRSLSIRLLQAQGETEAAINMQREDEIQGLRQSFGALSGPMESIVNDIYRIEKAARGLAAAASAVASTRQTYQSAIQSRITTLTDKQTAVDTRFSNAKQAYVDALNKKIAADDAARQSRISGLESEKSAISAVISETQGMVDAFGGLVESIRDYRTSLLTDDNMISMETRYKTARAQLDAGIKGMYSGDAAVVQESIGKIPDLSRTFLELSKGMGGDNYRQDLAKVMAVLNTSEAVAGNKKSVAEQQLDALNAQQDKLSRQISYAEAGVSLYQKMLDEVENQGIETKTFEEIQTEYNNAKAEFDNSVFQTEIDYWQAELTLLGNLTEGNTDILAALNDYQSALVSAIAGGYDDISGKFAQELALLESRNAMRDAALGRKIAAIPIGTATTAAAKASFAGGGTITGPSGGYTVSTTFHGTEHITPDSQMAEVKDVLSEVKGVLIQIRDTAGDQNLTGKKLFRAIDRVTQGQDTIRTQAVA